MKINRFVGGRMAVLLLVALWSFNFRAGAVLANAWHIPDNTNDLGFNMRNPEFEIGANTTVTVYSGVQKLNNSYGTANQTGGWLFYKGATQSSWSSNALSFYLDGSGGIANNQYWKATFNSSAFGTNEVIQYYLYLTFDSTGGGSALVTNTFVYGGDSGSATTAAVATAQASPFTLRNRPAWIFHGGNRVITAGTNARHRVIKRRTHGRTWISTNPSMMTCPEIVPVSVELCPAAKSAMPNASGATEPPSKRCSSACACWISVTTMPRA